MSAGERRAYGLCALGICGVVALEQVGEEEEFHHGEKQYGLQYDKQPEGAPRRLHGSEAVDIQIGYAAHKAAYSAGRCSGCGLGGHTECRISVPKQN